MAYVSYLPLKRSGREGWYVDGAKQAPNKRKGKRPLLFAVC